ncbi:hypothetical protein KV557_22940 [Kitasatospora aureofaciens]|uniref:MBL fold metallo-hydrolase n=1 Tax=Kitasatospora aureofaciens TaxID=1894 RepID=UPI001C4556DC|nr:hypothetical protein [Kitasatospora aureofaciens]MBV6699922.1 hypothetical protein [Kitasatospora aureofaciens]
MTDTSTPTEQIPVRVFGGPTALIEYGGLRFLTDPAFDAPGEYPRGNGHVLTKTAPAAIAAAELGPVDVVLLSHDEHPDNLDHSGRALLADVPLVLTTHGGAGRLGGTARTALFDGALLTLDSAQAAEAAIVLAARRVVPAHFDSWGHFTEGRTHLVAAFTAAGLLDRLELASA